MQIGILEPSDFSTKALERLRTLGSVDLYREESSLEEFLTDKVCLFVRLNYQLTSEVLGNAKHLKYLCTPTTGLNHIDLTFCKLVNISVISLHGEYEFLNDIRATSEHTLGLILALLRNYKKAFSNVASCHDRDNFKGFEIYRAKVGIIGLGRIGRILVSYLNAMGAECLYYDLEEIATGDIQPIYKASSINNLIRESDIICLCVAYNEQNSKLINKEYLELMKGKFFINTARGELVDEASLISKIKEGHFRGVALDVIAGDSLFNEQNRFGEIQKISKDLNFIYTPHIGGATFSSMMRTEEFITQKLFNHID
ncbi:MAG: D-3-phosphoglycerate dehydrogenase [Roseivirga sp.]|jgi:D-3-phosphoglycerate dehydrogenase